MARKQSVTTAVSRARSFADRGCAGSTSSACVLDSLQRMPTYAGSGLLHLALLILLFCCWPATKPPSLQAPLVVEPDIPMPIDPEPDRGPAFEPNLEPKAVERELLITTSIEITPPDLSDEDDAADAASGQVDAWSTPRLAVGSFAAHVRGRAAATHGQGMGRGSGRGSGGSGHGRSGMGGGRGNADGVDLALAWLKAHQHANGSWPVHIMGQPRHKPPKGHHAVGVTSLALLAFLGAGHTPNNARYGACVSRAMGWLLEQQGEDGHIGPYRYDAALGLTALAAAYDRCGTRRLQVALQRAIRAGADAQTELGGWGYDMRGTHQETPVTALWIMALRTAHKAELRFPGWTAVRAGTFVERIVDPATGRVAYAAWTDKLESVPRGGGGVRRSAVALTCLLLLGKSPSNRMINCLAERVLADGLPQAVRTRNGYRCFDFYRWYYATLGLSELGGQHPAWRQWGTCVDKVLRMSQIRVGTPDTVRGSWAADVDSYGRYWGTAGQTALGALMLETCESHSINPACVEDPLPVKAQAPITIVSAPPRVPATSPRIVAPRQSSW